MWFLFFFFFLRAGKHNNKKLREEVAAATTTSTKHGGLLADFCTGRATRGGISGHRSVAQQMKAQDKWERGILMKSKEKKNKKTWINKKTKISQIEIKD